MDAKAKKVATAKQRADLDDTVAAVWQATRRDADLSQEQCGDLLGLSRDVIGNIETGRRSASIAELIQFARAIKMDPELLFKRIVRWR
jgi:DNA-binding XRE family transcriptional regulator